MHDDIFVIPYAGALERNRHLGCIFRPLKCVNHIFFFEHENGGRGNNSNFRRRWPHDPVRTQEKLFSRSKSFFAFYRARVL